MLVLKVPIRERLENAVMRTPEAVKSQEGQRQNDKSGKPDRDTTGRGRGSTSGCRGQRKALHAPRIAVRRATSSCGETGEPVARTAARGSVRTSGTEAMTAGRRGAAIRQSYGRHRAKMCRRCPRVPGRFTAAADAPQAPCDATAHPDCHARRSGGRCPRRPGRRYSVRRAPRPGAPVARRRWGVPQKR